MSSLSQRHELERQLAAGYREQAGLYAQGLAQLQRKSDSPDVHDASWSRLNGVLERVAAVDFRLAPLKQRWAAGGTSPGPELQSALERVRSQLEELLAATGRAEQQARTARDRLSASADVAVQGQRMRRAYASLGD